MSLMIYLRKKYVSYIKIQDIIFFRLGQLTWNDSYVHLCEKG